MPQATRRGFQHWQLDYAGVARLPMQEDPAIVYAVVYAGHQMPFTTTGFFNNNTNPIHSFEAHVNGGQPPVWPISPVLCLTCDIVHEPL